MEQQRPYIFHHQFWQTSLTRERIVLSMISTDMDTTTKSLKTIIKVFHTQTMKQVNLEKMLGIS